MGYMLDRDPKTWKSIRSFTFNLKGEPLTTKTRTNKLPEYLKKSVDKNRALVFRGKVHGYSPYGTGEDLYWSEGYMNHVNYGKTGKPGQSGQTSSTSPEGTSPNGGKPTWQMKREKKRIICPKCGICQPGPNGKCTKNARRRLANQDQIDRFIRASLQCQ